MSSERVSDERLDDLAADSWVDEGRAMARELIERRAADAAKDAEIERLCEWKNAIEDAAVVDWVFTGDNPRNVVNALLANQARIAIDPLVSEDAAKMHGEIAKLREANRELVEGLRRMAELDDDCQSTIPRMDWREMNRLARELIDKHGGGL